MPGTADHGNALVTGLARLANALAHMGFAQCFALHVLLTAPMFAVLGQFFARRSHHLANAFKQRFAVAAFLDQTVPPALAIVKACGMGQPVQRIAVQVLRSRCREVQLQLMLVAVLHIGKRRGLRDIRCILLRVRDSRRQHRLLGFLCCLLQRFASCKLDGHAMGLGQVDEAGGNTLATGPLQCLPFG